MKTTEKKEFTYWKIMPLWRINNEYGNGEYVANPKVEKVSSWMFAGAKTWQEFAKWFNDFPADKEFKVLFIEQFKELCISTVDPLVA